MRNTITLLAALSLIPVTAMPASTQSAVGPATVAGPAAVGPTAIAGSAAVGPAAAVASAVVGGPFAAAGPAAIVRPARTLDVRAGGGSYWRTGAAVGFVVGAMGTYVWLHSGGSTSVCDRERNQDAIDAGPCLALTALGGVAGAAIGAGIGSRIRTEQRHGLSVNDVRVQLGRRSAIGVVVPLSRRQFR